MNWLKALTRNALVGVLATLAFPVLVSVVLMSRSRVKKMLLWGTDAFLHYKYWSDAMREAGWDSRTFVASGYSPIYPASNFDLTYDDLAPGVLRGTVLWRFIRHYAAFIYIARHCAVFHFSFVGGPLNGTPWRWLEGQLYRLAGVKTLIIPIGGDFWRYSTLPHGTARHAMMMVYPQLGREEEKIEARLRYWVRHADIIVGTVMIEGLGRWDTLSTNPLSLDFSKFPERTRWSDADGSNAPVTIVHAPNHRGVKGTEFFLAAVRTLQARGLKIDLVLLERQPNDRVREVLSRADISLDKCVGAGYGQFAIESMASGAAVLCSMEDDTIHDLHRQYSYLAECPLVSCEVADLENTLEALVRSPELRRELGQIGREYTRRYHSQENGRFFFGQIYEKLLSSPDKDIMTPYHPLSSEYRRTFAPLQPPLKKNRIP